MSITVGRYTFNSWLRRGAGTRIAEVDNLGAGVTPVKERPTIPIDVTLNTETIHKDFSLVGPGDIIGINPSMVVRTEPLHLITNFEPNYLPFVEFYDEEFEKFLLSLHDLNHPNADKIICRLMSPRKLRADCAYRAFVVPAFETGRLAGLGQDPSTIDAQKPSWT